MPGWEALQQGAPDAFFAEQRVDPATTRDCDGYPGLAAAPAPCPCGDPADCQECA